MLSYPCELCIPKLPVARGVLVERANRRDRFREPKLKIGMLSRELVRVLRRKSLQLIGEKLGSFYRV
jgi:hypothetical protein